MDTGRVRYAQFVGWTRGQAALGDTVFAGGDGWARSWPIAGEMRSMAIALRLATLGESLRHGWQVTKEVACD
jgi:hypothetical protein